jgi:hypothetical protein
MKTVEERARNDLAMLRLVLADADDRLNEDEIKAFRSMARWLEDHSGGKLSDKQRCWLDEVAARLDIAEPAANLVSEGVVPRGAEVPTPTILLNRPLKPPGRK